MVKSTLQAPFARTILVVLAVSGHILTSRRRWLIGILLVLHFTVTLKTSNRPRELLFSKNPLLLHGISEVRFALCAIDDFVSLVHFFSVVLLYFFCEELKDSFMPCSIHTIS